MKSRLSYIDNLRSFAVLLVVLDHVAQAYGLRFGGLRSWFVRDTSRTELFDYVHLVVDSFHMALFFFLASLFIIPSFERRGGRSFVTERFIKLGIPFVLGVIFLVPPQTYYKYVMFKSDIGFWDYVINTFFKIDWYASQTFDFDYPVFSGDLAASGFWFLSYLLFFSLIAIAIARFLPIITKLLAKWARWTLENPMVGFISMGMMMFISISIFELFYGDKYWLGFGKLFYARGNLFPTYVLLFLFGLGIGKSGLLKEHDWQDKLGGSALLWFGSACVLSVVYVWYCTAYATDGAYTLEILRYFYFGGTWANALPVISEEAPMTWIRTLLHGYLLMTWITTLMAVFYAKFNVNNQFWIKMSATAFGIYIFHETIAVPLVYYLTDNMMPTVIKFIIAGFGSWILSYLLLEFVLLKIPVVKRVIGQ